MTESASPALLKLVPEDDPILHSRTKDVSFPLSETDLYLIASMKYSIQPAQLEAANAPWSAASGMAANQWGHSQRIFVYFPDPKVDKLEVILNPSYQVLEGPQETELEGCFSVPKAHGKVTRICRISIEYQDESGQHRTGQLEGQAARTWCHENDHLDGFLYTTTQQAKCSAFRRFDTKAEAVADYMEAMKM